MRPDDPSPHYRPPEGLPDGAVDMCVAVIERMLVLGVSPEDAIAGTAMALATFMAYPGFGEVRDKIMDTTLDLCRKETIRLMKHAADTGYRTNE